MNARLLPSININDDIAVPSRFDHYHPTSRSLPIAKAVLAGRATMVIAAYGSGKSLSAGIGALAVANAPGSRRFLTNLAERIKPIDPDFARELVVRFRSLQRGRAVTLSGHVKDLGRSLAQALDVEPKRRLEDLFASVKAIKGVDRIAIVWDEFGRHLEGLVNEGRTRDLDIVQRLAEWTVRADAPSVSLTLLLHQNLLAYAGTLNQTSRNEWRKVEGRFETIRFVEDSREIYGLIANIVQTRQAGRPRGEIGRCRAVAECAIRSRWFDGMNDREAVALMLAKAYPLSAGALHILPLIVARVAQNERSLFAFLESANFSRPVGMEEVYLAFSDAMRSDVGVGGLHRRWIETESARSRASNEIEREVLAAACLLQLGVHGERKHLPRSVLEVAASSKGLSVDKVSDAVDALIQRKLLLYRKLNDDISVWHGADVDIASRLRDEKLRRAVDFDLLSFLSRHHPASFLRPVRHNAIFGTTRFLSGAYATATGLASVPTEFQGAAAGRILYVLCGSKDDVRKAQSFAEVSPLDRTVIVVPEEPIPVDEAALEVEVLTALRRDDTFVTEDPLVTQELDELLAVARRHLDVLLHSLLTDRPTATSWYAGGKRLVVGGDRPAGVAMSDLLDEWFPNTPCIVNDQMMRSRVSRQMSTNRVRLIMRLMEKSAEAALGYREDDGSAEASLYRTILARTGLHRTENGSGVFALPETVEDRGLSEVWRIIKDFFTREGKRTLESLVAILSAPPYGVPAGVMPILIMAGYRAFGRTVSLRSNGDYVVDILGFDAAKMFEQPACHEFEVRVTSSELMRYLEEIAWMFARQRPAAHDERVRVAYDAIRIWRSGIADGAIRSQRLTDDARIFLRRWSEMNDPAIFVLDTLPAIYGKGTGEPHCFDLTLKSLERLRNVIDRLVEGYLRDAVDVVQEVLALDGAAPGIAAVKAWVACFDVRTLMNRDDLRAIDKAVLRTTRETLDGRATPEILARAMSSLLLKRGIEKWQDDTKQYLKKELRECRDRIEAVALDDPNTSGDLAPILEARIAQLQGQLDRIRRMNGRGA